MASQVFCDRCKKPMRLKWRAHDFYVRNESLSGKNWSLCVTVNEIGSGDIVSDVCESCVKELIVGVVTELVK